MLITQKVSHIRLSEAGRRIVDTLPLQWYEASKRILNKRTVLGKELSLRFLKENQQLKNGDILYEDKNMLIVVEILPCETIHLEPESLYDLVFVCYEMGSKHFPLFYENGDLLIPYDKEIYNMLQQSGFKLNCETRQLIHQIKSKHEPYQRNDESFIAKLMQLTASAQE